MTLLYDQLLTNSRIPKSIMDDLRQCVVIEATNVSNYYYQGTDQEIWDLAKDFPNVAPPFDNFFLEFHAPQKIVSRETGTHQWHEGAPLKWGILCLGAEMKDLFPDLDTRTGQAQYRRSISAQMTMCEKTLGSQKAYAIREMVAMDKREQLKSLFATWPDSLKKIAGLYLMLWHLHSCLETGNWDEAKRYLLFGHNPDIRWKLGCVLFAQFRGGHLQSHLGPYWGWEMHVGYDGSLIKKSDGDIAEIMHKAYGTVEQQILAHMEEGHEEGMRFFETTKDIFMPLLHTTLLAISFMHCKNVALRQEIPQVTPTLKQRQYGIQPQPQVTYHVLDIEPMKQVLKTEGQSEKVGIQRSLHICRGHFAHYSEDKKLFGKYAGTFWKPQHVRGSTDIGIAAKDYRITKINGGMR